MPTAFYRCTKCRREWKTFEEAKNCEDSHLIPVSAKALVYTIRPFPYSIEIIFNNNERRIYLSEDLGGGLEYFNGEAKH